VHSTKSKYNISTVYLAWLFIRDYIPIINKSLPPVSTRADKFQDMPMGVDKEGGAFLYSLVRKKRAKTVIEFGTSMGISTIYLAAAVRDNGGGIVYTTELSKKKVSVAKKYIQECGLSDYVHFLQGDALQTLKNVDEVADLIFLDVWKEMYLSVLRLLEKNMHSNTTIVADDINLYKKRLKPYFDYVQSVFKNKKINIGHGILISEKC